jgi:uncharacterized membrane protein
MPTDNADPQEPTIFSAVLRPHRSLGRTGFLVLMLVYGSLSFAGGVEFAMMGAWPIFGIMALAVLLLYWAFRVNYARAAAYEEVTVTPSVLSVRKVSHRGRVSEYALNPLWVRLEKKVHEDYGIERLFLVSRGRELTLASFLGPDEKARFAKALLGALNEAKRGVTRTLLP